MSRWSAHLRIEVDDELLAKHPGATMRPPNAVEQWHAMDLFRALELELIAPWGLTMAPEQGPSVPVPPAEDPPPSPQPSPHLSAHDRQAMAREELESADLYQAVDSDEREQMIAMASSLVGHSVTDDQGRRWLVRSVSVHSGWPTISSGTFWVRADAGVDHGEAITAAQAIQTLREVLEEGDDVVKVLERLLPRVHPDAVGHGGIPLCPQCTSEDVGCTREPASRPWSCANCGATFQTPLQEAT